MLALYFGTWPLLLGVLAAAIPFALHLLSSVRAQDMMFPTLRFLRISMEKTARRRRLQHWLLLLLRAALFALLAIAVAEPFSEATGEFLGQQGYSAAIVLDNGYSMAVNDAQGNRFERAKAEATSLLSGERKPVLAALLPTSGGVVSRDLTDARDTLRASISRARIGYGPVPLAQRIRSAVEMLEDDSNPRQAVYVFSDMQRTSFEDVAALEDLARAKGVHFLIVDTSRGHVSNVGISDLQITGRRVVDSALEFTATLVNSSPTARTVDVAFQIDGVGQVRRVPKNLRPAGEEGSSAAVRFHHRFKEPGDISGKVFLDHADDLAVDNVRRFSMTIGGRVRAVIVPGPLQEGAAAGLEPATMLRLALQPYEEQTMPWPIRPRVVDIGSFATADVEAADVAFFCEVPRFTPEQAGAIAAFVRNGGTAVFFLGPDVDAANYNDVFVQQIETEGGLLPGRLDRPVGEIGPEAESTRVETVAIDHPYFAGLYESHADYLTVLAQRYYLLSPSARPGRTLVRLASGAPLIQLKPFGAGRVVLCTTSASPKWSNLPITGLFLPMVARISLLSRREMWHDGTYVSGAQVQLRPRLTAAEMPAAGEKVFAHVTPPNGAGGAAPFATVEVEKTAEGLRGVYRDTAEPGLYLWKLSRAGGQDGPAGRFVVNPFGGECRLRPMPASAFQRALKARGVNRVYVGSSLSDVHAKARRESEDTPWWDLFLAAVIIVLVFEAIVANRRGREEAVPTHLVPGAA